MTLVVRRYFLCSALWTVLLGVIGAVLPDSSPVRSPLARHIRLRGDERGLEGLFGGADRGGGSPDADDPGRCVLYGWN
jgi:hypothetical protein